MKRIVGKPIGLAEPAMNGHSERSRNHYCRMGLRRSLGVALAIAAVLMLLPTTAKALTIHPSGRPGTAEAPWAVLEGSTGEIGSWRVISGGRWVNESAAYRNYNQYVCVTHRLWHYYRGRLTTSGYRAAEWSSSPYRQRTACGWIPAAQTSIYDHGASFELGGTRPSSDYGVDVKIEWRHSPSGPTIGIATYDYDRVLDYRCRGDRCGAYDDGVGLGAYATWR